MTLLLRKYGLRRRRAAIASGEPAYQVRIDGKWLRFTAAGQPLGVAKGGPPWRNLERRQA